jgi:hypothetical protein
MKRITQKQMCERFCVTFLQGSRNRTSLSEEHRLRVFENRVLTIFGPKREEAVGGWRRLHNEELHILYSSQNIRTIKSRRMRLVGHVAGMGEMRNRHKILFRKT